MSKESDFISICGFNNIGLDPDMVGCGQPIMMVSDLYRCADCHVAFHLDCIKKHFQSTDVITQEMIDEQSRRDELRGRRRA